MKVPSGGTSEVPLSDRSPTAADTRPRAVPAGPAQAADWFPGTAADTGEPLRLICLSYAGGVPSAFHGWQQELSDRVRVVPVLLPGRGVRLHEAPHTVLAPLARALADALTDHGLAEDYALLGHSMGALLAYEVACELRDRGAPGPLQLFVSGSRAPHLYGDRADHALEDEALRDVIRDLGGLGSDDAVGNAYFDRRLPALRADLRACELYRWTPRAPLGCPVTAFSATEDPIATAAQVEPWRMYTTGPFSRLHLPGNHFFLNGPSRPRMLREVDRACGQLAHRLDDRPRTDTSRRNAS